MNICILTGRILSKLEFNFLYNSKIHISLLTFQIDINDQQTVTIKAYDEQADEAYKKLKKGDVVIIEGYLDPKGVNVEYIRKVA